METYAIHMKSRSTLAVTLNRISAYQHYTNYGLKKKADSLNKKQHHKFFQIVIHWRAIVFDLRHISFYASLLIYIENKPDKGADAL